MPCDMAILDDDRLRENGWTDAEIAQLRADMNKAETEARNTVMRSGARADDPDARNYIAEAVTKARETAHDRHHRVMEDRIMEDINNMAKHLHEDQTDRGVRLILAARAKEEAEKAKG